MNLDAEMRFARIADGLASTGIAIEDSFLDDREVSAIIQSDEWRADKLQFKPASIGRLQDRHIREDIRGDYIHWLDRSTCSTSIEVYLKRIDELIQYLNQSLFLSLKSAEIHLTQYPVGTFYKRHLDQFKSDDHRKISVICYLNVDWLPENGGQLRMYPEDKVIDVLPLAGRLACFRSDLIEHEVLPATRERRSLTGWLRDDI